MLALAEIYVDILTHMSDDPKNLLALPRVQEIIARAAAVYSRVSYSASSIRDLAAALDIKSASLYHYFSSKEDILFLMMINFHESFLQEVTSIALEPGEPEDIMGHLVEAHIRFDIRRLDEVIVSLRDRSSLSPERHDRINLLRRQHRDAVANLVSAGGKPGTWAAREPKLVASAILDTINGLVQWYRPRGEADLEYIIKLYRGNAIALMNVPADLGWSLKSSTRAKRRTVA